MLLIYKYYLKLKKILFYTFRMISPTAKLVPAAGIAVICFTTKNVNDWLSFELFITLIADPTWKPNGWPIKVLWITIFKILEEFWTRWVLILLSSVSSMSERSFVQSKVFFWRLKNKKI